MAAPSSSPSAEVTAFGTPEKATGMRETQASFDFQYGDQKGRRLMGRVRLKTRLERHGWSVDGREVAQFGP
ncbi:hypothetical protein FQN55_008078 [Onygenales sp. PD_40]|nr:hypothetical protein FQN55_008078 [Onygenales sp. PD_40]